LLLPLLPPECIFQMWLAPLSTGKDLSSPRKIRA
jgi:hypothetical protein